MDHGASWAWGLSSREFWLAMGREWVEREREGKGQEYLGYVPLMLAIQLLPGCLHTTLLAHEIKERMRPPIQQVCF